MGFSGLPQGVKSFVCHNCGHKFNKKVPEYQTKIMCPNCKDYYASIERDLSNAPRKRVVGKRRK
jgi:Zn finger protein HypA/HybF involved in hydrogenase expression